MHARHAFALASIAFVAGCQPDSRPTASADDGSSRARAVAPAPKAPEDALAGRAPARARDREAFAAALAVALLTPADPPAKTRRPPVSEGDIVLGADSAPVTVLVFGDHQCPYTARATAKLVELQRSYGDDRVRLAWKSLPLQMHRSARLLARGGEAVARLGGPSAFFRYSADAFAAPRNVVMEDVASYARRAGVAAETVAVLLRTEDAELDAKIEADIQLASELGIRAVPYVFINDQELAGDAPREELAQRIESELSLTPAR